MGNQNMEDPSGVQHWTRYNTKTILSGFRLGM